MLTVSDQTLPPLRHPWRNAIAVGRAYDLLRADLQAHLRGLQGRMHWRSCRFHAVFDDDMQVVRRLPDGSLAYQWGNVDQAYEFLLSIGLKPFVELNPMPSCLASGSQTMFWYKMNVTPPKDWGEWEALIEAFARHLVARYGLDEVRSWCFEVWNEPNLAGFFSGTKEDYFRLYACAARALKRVDAGLRVGGPATSKANWIGEFIAWCAKEGLPLDFVSTHLYPQDEYVDFPERKDSPHAVGAFFADTVRGVQAEVRASPKPDLPIHWTEWNAMCTAPGRRIDWSTNTSNDELQAAAFVCHACTELDGVADTLCWWVASDIFVEGGPSLAPFSMTYGLCTIHGIPKASAQAFVLLGELRGCRRGLALGEVPHGAGACATEEGGQINLLLWYRQHPELPGQPIWRDRLEIAVPDAAERLVLSSRLRAGAGSCYETWRSIGSPQDLSAPEEALLRAQAEPERRAERHSPHGGRIGLEATLQPGEVLLLQIRPVGRSALPRQVDAKALAAWDAIMGDRSR